MEINEQVEKENFYSLKRTISYLLTSNLFNFTLVFFSSLIIFREIDRNEYGLYILMVSFIAITELFMGGYNQAITRYLKEKIPLIDKQHIVLYSIYYKYGILLVFSFIVLAIIQFGLIKYIINDYSLIETVVDKYIVVILLSSIVSILSGVSVAILTALQNYKIVNNSLIIKNLIYLIFVICLIYITNNYIVFLYVSLILNFLLFIYYAIKLNLIFPEYSLVILLRTKLDLSIYKKYLFSYATPLTTISLLSYTKNHLPIIILGKEFELSDLAVFSIIKKFFKTLHTISGSFLQPLLSKFIEMKNNNILYYKYALNNLYYYTLIARIVIYLSLMLVSDYFFLIYKIEILSLYTFSFAVLGFEFVLAGIMSLFGTILNTNKSTKKLLFISSIRFTLEIILIYYLLIDYGIVAAVLILLMSRYFEIIIAYLFVRREKIISMLSLHIIIILPFIMYSAYKGFF